MSMMAAVPRAKGNLRICFTCTAAESGHPEVGSGQVDSEGEKTSASRERWRTRKGAHEGTASLEETVNTLARLVLQHEDAINTAKLDRGLVFYLHNTKEASFRPYSKSRRMPKKRDSRAPSPQHP